MSGRGRFLGRGYGGRGRGRGRGFASDGEEEGDKGPRKPAPLYPDIQVPELPSISSTDREVLDLYRSFVHFWKKSPYHIDSHNALKDDGAMEADTNLEKRRLAHSRASLLKSLSLDPTYFPEELYSNKDQRLSNTAGPQVFSFNPDPTRGLDVLDRLEELAKGEGSDAEGEEAADEELAERRAKEELRLRAQLLEREELDGFDSEDEEAEEDDALGTHEYDVYDEDINADDEEYMEDDDGGYDEGPIY